MRTYVFGAGVREAIVHPEPDPEGRLVDVLEVEEDESVWIVGEDGQVETELTVQEAFLERASVTLIRHKCHQVSVSITYNGRNATFEVPPSRTVAALLNQALADPSLGIDQASASDFELREPGSDSGLDPELPVGALTTPGHCRISLILAACNHSAG
jgi:hypothetical protein